MKKEIEIYNASNKESLVATEWFSKWSVMRVQISDFDHLQYLPAYNKQKFLSLYGKQDFCTEDGSGRRLYVWRKELKSGNIWVLAGNQEKGTTFELEKTVSSHEAEEFFELLIDKLKKIKD